VKGFIRDHGMPPTVHEIGAAFGIKSSSVFELLKAFDRPVFVLRCTRGERLVHGRKSMKQLTLNTVA
jgi:hypothetical protein